MPTKKRRQRGGASPKLVGQGTYGCGFSPALRCNTNTEQPANTFSKFMNASAATNEEHITTRIKNINGTQRYSVYPTKKCTPHLENIKAHGDELKRCGMLEQYIVSYPTLVQSWFNPSFENKLIANIDLYKLLQSPQGGTALNTYIASISLMKDPKTVIQLFVGLTNLFEGLIHFHQQKYYHMDIKPPNIVVKDVSDTGIPLIRFIDFGLSIDGNAPITDVAETFRKSYFAWPFELRYFNQLDYAANRKDVSLLIAQLRDFYKNSLEYCINVHAIPESQYMDSADGSPTFRGAMIKPLLQRLIAAGKDSNFLFATADVYAMGVLLSSIIYKLSNFFLNNDKVYYDNAGVERPINTSAADDMLKRFAAEFATDALKLAAQCTQVDPLSRPTTEELYNSYTLLVGNLRLKTEYILTGTKQPTIQKKQLPPLPASATVINIPASLSQKKLKTTGPARIPSHILQQQKNLFRITKKA